VLVTIIAASVYPHVFPQITSAFICAKRDAADSVLKGHGFNCVFSKLLSILVPI